MKYLIILFVLFTFSTNINQKPIVITYDDSLDLILIERTLTHIRNDYTNDIELYQALYKEQDSDQLYLANLQHTNNIIYSNTNYYMELVFNEGHSEELAYIGSISPLERIYIDTNTQEQFIKTLSPYKDEYYIAETWYVGNKENTYVTNKLTTPLVYFISEYYDEMFNAILYTNAQDQLFARGWDIKNTNRTHLLIHTVVEVVK